LLIIFLFTDVLLLVLHPYYKLTYIEMAWGGVEEQRKAQDEGNLNAKDWCDEARQIIERVMEDYWNESLAPQGNAQAMSQHTTTSDEGNGDHGVAASLASEYDHHCHTLIERTAARADSSRWKAELHTYLGSIPEDVSKETDIIQWWSVSHLQYPVSTH
jgi:hypothetical protein